MGSKHCLLSITLLGSILFSFSFAEAKTSPAAQNAALVVSEKAAPQIKFGAAEIRKALEKKGVKISGEGKGGSAAVRIYLGAKGDSHLSGIAGERSKVPEKQESYGLSVPSSKVIVVEGSDATGAMYGALDLAEQIGWASGDDFAGQIKPVSKSPYLELRGINMFPTTQDIDDPKGAFWSDEYWTGYFEMMARNRYNLLDMHGPCDAVTLTFPDVFSYFVSLPEFPEVGVGPERAAKNVARLRQVIQMGADHGVKLAFMNYEAPPPIGPWKTRRFGVDERWTPITQEFLKGPRLEVYVRKAVGEFLKQLPGLWMFGFRVGESGQGEDFYKKTYVEALKDAPASLNVYARTWIADPQKVRELAGSLKQRFFIEPKYNGEQLGSPYQAALGGRQYPPSGSYEDYTNYPKNYSILWQIRAHGTHRVFFWGSPEFARRTVRSCKFGEGAGFSMEPMEAYCPANDYLHNNPKVGHNMYKWMFEREWLWHLTWGRAAYDPDVPDKVWISEFERRFGPGAGVVAYRALVESSKIVPFIFSYHNVGLDHQDFAPEFETGDHPFSGWARFWQGKRLVPLGGNNDDFLRVGTIDRTAMSSPSVYVKDFLDGRVSGKMTPAGASEFLNSAADASERAIHEAGKLAPASAKEFECIQMDVEALAALARYYADRIQSATHLEFYRRTNHHPELSAAYEYMHRAAADWDRLADVADGHYGYVPELIRMGVNQYRWRDEGKTLGVDLEQINELEGEYRNIREKTWDERTAILGHVPPVKAEPGRALPLTMTFVTGIERGHAYLFYRNQNQTAYKKVALKLDSRQERTWTGEIPADDVVPGHLEYYFEADTARWGHYGGTIPGRPPYFVYVNSNNSKPVISHTPPAGKVRGESVAVEASVDAKAKIASVRVYYKPMPAPYEWVSLEMESAGGNRYRAQVPLTSEGILYYFEAIDADGNASNYPNFLERTPYFALDGWDPGK